MGWPHSGPALLYPLVLSPCRIRPLVETKYGSAHKFCTQAWSALGKAGPKHWCAAHAGVGAYKKEVAEKRLEEIGNTEKKGGEEDSEKKKENKRQMFIIHSALANETSSS